MDEFDIHSASDTKRNRDIINDIFAVSPHCSCLFVLDPLLQRFKPCLRPDYKVTCTFPDANNP